MAHEWHMERSIPVPESGCWLWLGCTDGKGYGMVTVARTCYRAHRLSYMKSNNCTLGAYQVLHKCDTPSCINPDHLFLGSNADNVADKVAKGRQATGEAVAFAVRGERQWKSKLNENSVRDIRASKLSGAELSKVHGVSTSVISEIKSRKAWKHIKDDAA